MEWTKQTYNEQYEKWVPWLEDLYLRWFTKDNKASYTTKQNLDKTKVTGVEQVATLQDGANDLVAGQVGQGGLLQPAGDYASQEGLNRVERQGKDEQGRYATGTQAVPGGEAVEDVVSGAAEGGKSAGTAMADGAKNTGSFVGGLWGGGKK